jgi:hypothetical protein
VYLGGGIAPRIVERLRSGPFLTAFGDKGRMSELMSRIPVHVIMNPRVGLLGAAAVAGRMEGGEAGKREAGAAGADKREPRRSDVTTSMSP